MFCANCGKQIEDTDKFCPYCGAATTDQISDSIPAETSTPNVSVSNKQKKGKLIIYPIIAAILIVVVFAIIGLTKFPKNEKYDFLIKDVVSVQKDTIDSIDVRSYLPADKIYKEYSQELAKGHPEYDVTKGYYFERNGEYSDYVYVSSSEGMNNYNYGTIYYDEEQDCLIDFNQKNSQRILPQIGDRVEQINGNGYILETSKTLFTVKTETMTYKDCIAVISTDTTNEEGYTPQGVAFYAKNIGEVLYLFNAGIENDEKVVGKFFVNQSCDGVVTEVSDSLPLISALQRNRKSLSIEDARNQLDSITNGEYVEEEYAEKEMPAEAPIEAPADDYTEPYYETETYGAEYELFEGMRFECFETQSGEDVIVTIKIYESESSGISYKAEFSDGKELWLEFLNSERDGRDYYYVEAANGTMSFTGSDLEIEFNDDYYQSVNGTYISIPDLDQVENDN